jgi:hypothetical protein
MGGILNEEGKNFGPVATPRPVFLIERGGKRVGDDFATAAADAVADAEV